MINFVKNPGDRILELGCGNNPHPESDVRVDVRPIPGVTHFTADFTLPFTEEYNQAIGSDEFAGVFAHFVIEHLPYRVVPGFLKECLRVLRPGGTLVAAVPNTAAQMDWVKANPGGWDGKELFEAASEKLFGSQNMPDEQGQDHNTHKAYFSPQIAIDLLSQVGFADIRVMPYGARNTDMIIAGKKPTGVLVTGQQRQAEYITTPKPADDPDPDRNPPAYAPGSMGLPDIPQTQFRGKERVLDKKPDESIADHIPYTPVNLQNPPTQESPQMPSAATGPQVALPTADAPDPAAERGTAKNTGWQNPLAVQGSLYDPARMFNRDYFDGGKGGWGGYAGEGYRDFPVHHVIARHVLERKPESVLECGTGRGYTLKRVQDAGVVAAGMDVSRHCHLTRVCEAISLCDLTVTPWVVPDHHTQVRRDLEYDLCFSIGFLDHLPTESLPAVVREMARTCKRGLHGVNPDPLTDGDRTRLSAGKSLHWWKQLFATHAPGWPCEIVPKGELETAKSPDWQKAWMEGDGRLKLNLGCYATQFHFGWTNIDQHDLGAWAAAQGYHYQRHDLRGGIPYHTASVDLLFLHHVLEHFDYKAGLSLLRECRRVIRPTGALRVVVPNMEVLCGMYAGRKLNLSRDYEDGECESLTQFDEMNTGCAESPTIAGKLWSLLCPDHQAGYDEETLCAALEEAGFDATPARFRFTAHDPVKQILRECVEMPYGPPGSETSLFVDAIPRMD